MKRINISNIVMLMAVVLFLFASCRRELDVAPVATYDGKATHTIAQLLEFHPLTVGFTYDTLPQGIVIEGTVISSDKEGNCYKYITIDDGTAAVQIKINSSTLYPNYPLGQHLFVNCDGLILGDYGMLHQLGWWENDGIQGISTNKLYKHIFKDGVPGPDPQPSVELSSANQIQANMYNRLVRLKNVHFTDPGQVYANTTASGTENEITFEDGTKIILYTSMYAKFANELTPAGVFDMVALLSRFRTTNQLVIRSLNDIGTPVVPPTYTEVIVNAMDLSQNPLDNGWTNQVIAGSNWEYMSGNAMRIVGSTGANDTYNGFSYFLSVEKKFNMTHALSLTAWGAPTVRGMQAASVQEAYDITGTHYYNPNWGWYQGKKRNARMRTVHEPVIMLTHYYTPDSKLKMTTTLAHSSNAVRILSAASSSPPNVFSSINKMSAFCAVACSMALSNFRCDGRAILSSILK